MKIKNIILLAASALLLGGILAGCGTQPNTDESSLATDSSVVDSNSASEAVGTTSILDTSSSDADILASLNASLSTFSAELVDGM